MDNITIVCSVAAEFTTGKGGREVFMIRPSDRNLIMTAPAWIEKTLLFRMLVQDGSMRYVTRENRVQMENEPTTGIQADGKAAAEEQEESKPETPKRRGGRKKAETTVEEE